MTWRRWILILVVCVAAALVLLWLVRARLAAQIAGAYFRSHGVASTVEIGDLGLSGVSGRFALGPAAAPDVAAERIELHFDPLSWIPRVVEVRLVRPVIRARIDEHGAVTLPSLQNWITSLQQQQGKSRFVSDDLAVSLTGLRALLDTPAGALELNGDVKLVRNLPVSLRLTARPAALAWRGVSVRLASAKLSYVPGQAQLRVSGAGEGRGVTLQKFDADASATGLAWTASSVRMAGLELRLAAATAKSDVALQANLHDVVALSSDSVTAGLRLSASAHAGADVMRLPPTGDAILDRALAANLMRVQVALAGNITRRSNRTQFQLTAPLQVSGARGARLSVPELTLAQDQNGILAQLRANVSGGGVPEITLASRNLSVSSKGAAANVTVGAHFNYAMLRDVRIHADDAVWKDGQLRLQTCARVSLSAFHPGTSDMAKAVSGSLCPATGRPLFATGADGWAFRAAARDVTAMLPLTNTRLDDGAAALAFDGKGGKLGGVITLATSRMTDLAPAPRFHPLLGSGAITLADGVWRGRVAVSDLHQNKLADTSFTHAMASGDGTVHISAPKLTFAPDHLQPQDISPLLAQLRRAEGSARFEGDLNWTHDGITSSGTLGIDSLDFMTLLGKAHAVKTDIRLVSLLLPVTAPDQQIAISRIDWTLPFTGIALRFAVGDGALTVRNIDTDFAEGHASLGGFTINLSDPKHIAGAIQFKSIALNSLINASNLGSKVKMDGKVSGSVPFTVTPDGFRIRDGHVAADGPGHLSFDRSLWTQAGPAANAVQDFAYQALEHLGFDSLSADLNSIPGGRLQVVFKIKGKSDPPKLQTADVAVADILNGTALYKPIPLPSATPIDLTLDTSLNFDELLKSYAEAWSKSLDPGASP
ncbi:MAG: hypothetical protein JWN16_2479 [Alphaproteobacteria bacterium]|nr:hypothetical protein [Alphaproteobacteria bacterium]